MDLPAAHAPSCVAWRHCPHGRMDPTSAGSTRTYSRREVVPCLEVKRRLPVRSGPQGPSSLTCVLQEGLVGVRRACPHAKNMRPMPDSTGDCYWWRWLGRSSVLGVSRIHPHIFSCRHFMELACGSRRISRGTIDGQEKNRRCN
jgi:hypothetical protein